MNWIKGWGGNLIAIGIGIVISCLILEIFLRYYQPFPFRIKGDKIILKTNTQYRITNNSIPGLDTIIIHRKNALGFRGPDIPEKFNEYISIITIGGSTAECFYISEGKTWPDILQEQLQKRCPRQIWLNNAGLDGHSTFGHLVLLQDYVKKLKPNFVIFLVGLNDVRNNTPGNYDLRNFGTFTFWPPKEFVVSLANHSEVASTILNLYRVYEAKYRGVLHHKINLGSYQLSHVAFRHGEIKKIEQENEAYLNGYKRRIRMLITICRDNNMIPIFITQPALYGKGKDELTGTDLEKIIIDKMTGAEKWFELELYNKTLIQTCREQRVFYVDLANLLDKRSDYFYDFNHYTNKGAERIGHILAENLDAIICSHSTQNAMK